MDVYNFFYLSNEKPALKTINLFFLIFAKKINKLHSTQCIKFREIKSQELLAFLSGAQQKVHKIDGHTKKFYVARMYACNIFVVGCDRSALIYTAEEK